MKDKIRKIPGNEGWWKSRSEDTFNEVAKKMKSRGFEEGEIINILSDLYYAVTNCYGD